MISQVIHCSFCNNILNWVGYIIAGFFGDLLSFKHSLVSLILQGKNLAAQHAPTLKLRGGGTPPPTQK